MNCWRAFSSPSSIQTFQKLVVSYLWAMNRDYSVPYHARELLYTGLTDVWRGRVNKMFVDGILAQSRGGMGVGGINSKHEDKSSGMGCFAWTEPRKEMVIDCYNGKLVHESCFGDKEMDRRYVREVMLVRVKQL